MSVVLLLLGLMQLGVLLKILATVGCEPTGLVDPVARVGDIRRSTVEALLAAESAERGRQS